MNRRKERPARASVARARDAALFRALVVAAALASGCTSEVREGGSRPDVGGAGGAADAACWDKADAESCFYCCMAEHPDGGEASIDALTPCVCQPEECGSVCASSLCAEPVSEFDAACSDCVTSSSAGPCAEEVAAACDADPICAGLLACQMGCF